MKPRMMWRMLLVCVLLGVLAWCWAPTATAQSADQKLATQSGLGSKQLDKDKLPGKLEFGITAASVIGAIAAIKYL
ncbi:MAG TPA: hypothetical protein PKX28_10210 [Candidatus Hydrogenedentes bacterium]|nr:hypothetical protein [Candidatus Hydrogenedentota bacterium]HOV59508.1 hypothetical protein [Candidatus Hydrogenedentota bacterium]HPO31607.1 hypothetical protein [Candidatus Hydrogenedentota bacterium]